MTRKLAAVLSVLSFLVLTPAWADAQARGAQGRSPAAVRRAAPRAPGVAPAPGRSIAVARPPIAAAPPIYGPRYGAGYYRYPYYGYGYGYPYYGYGYPYGSHFSFGFSFGYPGYYGYAPYWYGLGYPVYGYGGYGGGYGGYGYPGGAVVVAPGQAYGGVRLDLSQRKAEVYADGYFAGTVDNFDGTFQQLNLEPGPHKIEIRAPGFETISIDVNVQPGQTITYRADMRPIQ